MMFRDISRSLRTHLKVVLSKSPPAVALMFTMAAYARQEQFDFHYAIEIAGYLVSMLFVLNYLISSHLIFLGRIEEGVQRPSYRIDVVVVYFFLGLVLLRITRVLPKYATIPFGDNLISAAFTLALISAFIYFAARLVLGLPMAALGVEEPYGKAWKASSGGVKTILAHFGAYFLLVLPLLLLFIFVQGISIVMGPSTEDPQQLISTFTLLSSLNFAFFYLGAQTLFAAMLSILYKRLAPTSAEVNRTTASGGN